MDLLSILEAALPAIVHFPTLGDKVEELKEGWVHLVGCPDQSCRCRSNCSLVGR